MGGVIGGAIGNVVAPGIGGVVGSAIGGGLQGAIGGGSGGQSRERNLSQSFFPDWYSEGRETLITDALDVYNQPFTPYEDQRFADFTPDELAAFQQVRDLQGQYSGLTDQASSLLGGVADRALTAPGIGALQEYMNPYLQGVTDIAKREAIRDFEPRLQRVRDTASMTGAFGGGRAALAESEAYRNINERLNDIQTQGLAQGYNQALGQYNLGTQTGMQAAGALGNLAGQTQNLALQGTEALRGVGSMQRALEQAGLDFNFQEFMREQQYPYQQTQYLGGALGMVPWQSFPRQGQLVSTPPQGSTMGNILGGAMQGVGMGSGGLGGLFGGGDTAFGGSLGGGWSSSPYSGGDISWFKDGGQIKGYQDGGGIGDFLKNAFRASVDRIRNDIFNQNVPQRTSPVNSIVEGEWDWLDRHQGLFGDIQRTYGGSRGGIGEMMAAPDYSGNRLNRLSQFTEALPRRAVGKMAELLNTPGEIGQAMRDYLMEDPDLATPEEDVAPEARSQASLADVISPRTPLSMGERQGTQRPQEQRQAEGRTPGTPSSRGPMSLTELAVQSLAQGKRKDTSDKVNLPMLLMGSAMLSTPGTFAQQLGAGGQAYAAAIQAQRKAEDPTAMLKAMESIAKIQDYEMQGEVDRSSIAKNRAAAQAQAAYARKADRYGGEDIDLVEEASKAASDFARSGGEQVLGMSEEEYVNRRLQTIASYGEGSPLPQGTSQQIAYDFVEDEKGNLVER